MPINVTSELYNNVRNSPPPRRTKKPRIDPTPEQLREIENKVLDSVQVINMEMFNNENRPIVTITGDKNFEITKVVLKIIFLALNL